MTTKERAPGGIETILHERIHVGDYQAMVHRAGVDNDTAIVFLHGAGPGATGWSNWQHALPALGMSYHCLAPDYIGFGDSDHPDPPPTDMRVWTRLRIDQVIGMLDTLGIERAHLAGNSLGGAIALNLLLEAPERFDRAVLMGTPGGPPPRQPTRELASMISFYKDPSPAALARLSTYFLHDRENFDGDLDAIARDRYQVAMRPEVRRSYEAQFSGPVELVLPDSALRQIQHRVLLIHGLGDAMNPVEASNHLQRQLPNADLYVFANCGHWVQLEHPRRFHQLVTSFFHDEL